MADLAFIHPLLVRNPLPPDRLDAALKQASIACAHVTNALGETLRPASLDNDYPALAEHATLARRRARHWHDEMLPALATCMDGVARFASQFNQALPGLHNAAADMEVDPGARARLQAGFALQREAAGAQLAVTRRVATTLDSFRCSYARDFVAFVVDVDAAKAMLGNAAPARAQLRQQVDVHQRLIGDAMAAVTQAIAALAAMEAAWSTLANHFEALETQLQNGELGSGLLEARLNSARQEWSALSAIERQPPRLRGQGPAPEGEAARLQAVSGFRHADIGAGAEAVTDALALIDNLAQGIADFPSRDSGGVPAVVRHIGAVKRLAQMWAPRGRPALTGALAALKNFGDAFVEVDALRLQQAFDRIATDDGARLLAAELVGGLIERLGALATTFEAVAADIEEYLARMSGVSSKLGTDTAAVTERLRAEHERAQSLSGKAAGLQEQINAASEHSWRWLLGPIVARQVAVLEANLRGVSTQLDELRLDQAATMDDASYLQSLLPALSTCLSGMDQVGAGIVATLGGIQALQLQLAELKQAIASAPAAALPARRQLQGALADWRDISACVARLPQP